MFKYFSISDVQYFRKSDLYFCQIIIFWFPKKFNQDGATVHLQVENVVTIWCIIHCFHILVTRLSYLHKFGHKEAPLASVANWVPKWHNLCWFKICSSASATCIASNVGHQIALLALLHCLGLPYWHYQLVLSWYPHQPESHQLSLQKLSHSVTDIRTQRSDPRFTWVR